MKKIKLPPLPKNHRFLTDADRVSVPSRWLKRWSKASGDGWEPSAYGRGEAIPNDDWGDFFYAMPLTVSSVRQPKTKVASRIPDSGARTDFGTGAVRDASVGKGLPSRIPPIALHKLAVRFEDGATKYPDGPHGPNWMQGIPLSRFYDAIVRHAAKAAQGEDDEDHLGAVLWNASAWAWTEEQINAGILPSTLNDLPFHKGGATMRFIAASFKK